MAKRSFSAINHGKPSTKAPQRKKLCRPIREGPRFGTNIITLLVGPDAKVITVHESALRSSSHFFDAALSHNWKEQSERTIKLPTFNRNIVRIYIKWLYYGLFFMPAHNVWRVWAQLYEFADYIMDPGFKDAAIDVLIEQMLDSNEMPPDLAWDVYPFSIEGSKHRKLVLDCTPHLTNDPELRELVDRVTIPKLDVPQEFFEDVMRTWKPDRRMSPQRLLGGNTCRYHEHGELEGCYRDRKVYRF